MRAIVMRSFGSPAELVTEDVELPEPGPGEVRVRVRAAFVSRTRDVDTRSGLQPVFSRAVSLPHILGGDCAGVVDVVGVGTPQRLIGTRVAVSCGVTCGRCEACRSGATWGCGSPTVVGVHRPGSYAEAVVVPVANVEELPDEVSFATGAVLVANGPLAAAQLDAGGVTSGSWALVPGASGSLGSIVAAIAVKRGARVIALSRRPAAMAALQGLGVEAVLDPRRDDLTEVLLGLTGHGVDVTIDNVASAELWARYAPALAPMGRVVISGVLGDGPLSLDPRAWYFKSLSLIGLRTADARHAAAFWDAARADGVQIPEDLIQSYPLEQAAAAHASLEQGDKLGHYVLTMDGRAP
jgi:D-arabinose 1-dehydrogenase-like Zn-dependent alcohol dehydrogenase